MIAKPLIRRFQSRDLRRILKIEDESFGCDAWPADIFREYARVSPNLFLVATVGNHMAGYSIASFARGNFELASIAVLSKYRGEGVASALLKANIRKAKRLNVSSIWLMVRTTNQSAVDFYKHRRFVRMSTVARYYEDGSAGWRMKLTLD